jgi:disulfide bond formation protein DsbB
MLSRQLLNRIIIIGFMVLVGFCLAKAIYNNSFMGIVLALVSLGAAIYFLYILVKAREEMSACTTDRDTERTA